MTMSFTEKSVNKYRSELRTVTNLQARKFIFEHGYDSSSFEMPEYYGASGLGKVKLKSIDWNKVKAGKEQVLITKPLNFLTPKGFLAWRSFNLLHPYIFVHIVNTLTDKKSWEEVKVILCKKTLVHCYSTPNLNENSDSKTKAENISRWIQMAENDLIKDCVNYNFLTITDIKNFYPSIYTHSIAWAVSGKKNVKQNRRDFSLLGNKLDKLFQNARDGQTNGIPVGSMVSDLVAELILKDVDNKLSDWVRKNVLDNKVLIARYRDDYRILSNSREEGTKVLKQLSKILEKEYNLALNAEKTKVYEDIIEGSFREWSSEINNDYLLRSVKYKELGNVISSSLLKDILLKTYRLQKEYPDGRASITLLSKLSVHIKESEVNVDVDKTDIQTIISILRKLALVREEVSAQTYLLLDTLLSKLDEKSKDLVIEELYEVIKDQSDQDYQVIWFYRLCLSNKPEKCEDILKSSHSPLIDLIKDEYVGKNPFRYNYEIFEVLPKLTKADRIQLQNFNYLDQSKLVDAQGTLIDWEEYDLFSY